MDYQEQVENLKALKRAFRAAGYKVAHKSWVEIARQDISLAHAVITAWKRDRIQAISL